MKRMRFIPARSFLDDRPFSALLRGSRKAGKLPQFRKTQPDGACAGLPKPVAIAASMVDAIRAALVKPGAAQTVHLSCVGDALRHTRRPRIAECRRNHTTGWDANTAIGVPVARVIRVADHTGCVEGPDLRRYARTVMTDPLTRFLCWNMPYHCEHLLAPAVPFHALPAFHRDIGDQLNPVDKGY